MLTLLLAICTGLLLGFIGYLIYPSYILAGLIFAAGLITFNVLMGRYFMKKLTAVFNSCEKDLKTGRTDAAIEKMKKGYDYAKWQFMVKNQIDTQIGIILYANKKFEEALPYLKNTMARNWMGMSMLAAYYFKQKDYEKAKEIMAKSAKASPKDSFTQVLNAYILAETGNKDGAIAALTKAGKKLAGDEKLENALEALRNNKKIKMQAYGTLWLQLHLAKAMPEGAKPWQAMIGRQHFKRR